MAFNDFWNKFTGKPPADKPEEKPKPQTPKPQAPKPVAKPEPPSAAEQRKQAEKDRIKTPGPAERYLVKNPDVLQKAVDAKADRENPKPTKHDYVPPSQPKPGPMVQTPMGMRQAPAPSYPPKPPQQAPPTVPRTPTNADKMLDRAAKTPPPKPPIQSFREAHPDLDKGRSP